MKLNYRGSISPVLITALLLIIPAALLVFRQGHEKQTPNLEQSTSPLATLTLAGGYCRDKECPSSVITINKDGTFLRDQESKGTLNQEELTLLKNLINTTNYGDVKKKRNDKNEENPLCPSSYDGVDIKYTFYTLSNIKEVNNCVFEIDYSLPLFQAVETLRNKYN